MLTAGAQGLDFGPDGGISHHTGPRPAGGVFCHRVGERRLGRFPGSRPGTRSDTGGSK